METESNVRRMTALMAFMDAAVQGGPRQRSSWTG